ncbi:ATP-dependent DNA helicase [Psychrobacter cibarius]|uniref:ATP-dependent DNA helicase n=1 Tax=Psychrobacter cibarius TaxID=282669 RepID=UPI001D104E6B|nr:AAA family ATPase [Psychrobacter cibarius]
MSNNKKESKAVIGLQQSWASNISDYILLRREQTYLAYKATDAKANTNSKQVDKTEESNLFTALFVMLATHLEEGHTVLTIESSEHEEALQGQINDEVVTLYAWQQQLLEMLAMPIFTLIDTKINTQSDDDSTTERSLFVLLDTLFDKRDQLWMQLALSNHEKEVLTKRFDMIATLYQLLKNTDLSFFIRLVNEHDLFAEVNTSINNNDKLNSLSRKNQPIIYKKVNSQNTEGSAVSLTFWLHRAWQAEFNLAKNINNILNQQVSPLQIAMPENLHEHQVKAINVANNNAFSIITGGPGTGKTYTVAQLVIALQQATESREDGAENIRFSTDSASLALAAPTGKAAQRMQESLQAALDAADIDLQLQEAKTIHRLLGIGRTGRPRYDTNNPLGEDIIIVDEASMLGVELANYLVSAVKPGARLILLGDANQLAAVDAGAVLADLCRIPLLQPIHAELTESRRFSAESGIGKLAYQINQAEIDTQAIWQLLRQDEALSFHYVNTLQTNELKDNKTRNSLSNKKLF